MHLLLFHGIEILALFGGAFIGLGIFIGMLVWAFRGPTRPWVVPLTYLIIGLLVSVLEIYTDNFFGLAVMFAFPWSVLLVIVSTVIDKDVGLVWFLPSIVINTTLFYLTARYRSNNKLQNPA